MGDTLCKLGEAIKVVYQAPNAESGLNNVKMEIYDELSVKSSDYLDVTLTEIESSGRYEGSFTPDAKGDWTVVIEKADGSGKVVKHYSVGAYNVDTLGENIDGVSTDIGAVDTAVVDLDGDVAVLDTKVDTNAGITDANVDAKAAATDSNVDAKAIVTQDKIDGLNDLAASDVETENDKVRGGDSDTLKTLSDQLDGVQSSSPPMVS